DLPNLQALVLKSNNFHGHIQPSSTVESPFPSLQIHDLSHNGFVGQLPAKYFQNFNSMKNVVKSSTTPEYLYMGGNYYSFIVAVKGLNQDFPQISVDYIIIDLSRNAFEGQIPNVIGGLNSLIVLNLSHNTLIGPIPHALWNLIEIESLDLSWNQLSGEIPQSEEFRLEPEVEDGRDLLNYAAVMMMFVLRLFELLLYYVKIGYGSRSSRYLTIMFLEIDIEQDYQTNQDSS
ncbi:leucine-rich repeat-containing protein, partial [Tanacetum coccineum]